MKLNMHGKGKFSLLRGFSSGACICEKTGVGKLLGEVS